MTYQHFAVISEKDAPSAEYESHDGTVKINLDVIWDQTKDYFYSHVRTDIALFNIIDAIIHEDNHKAIAEAHDPNIESFNEQDERIFRCVSDWIEFDKKISIVQYDWK